MEFMQKMDKNMQIITMSQLANDTDVCLILNEEDLKSCVQNVFFPKLSDFKFKFSILPDIILYKQPTFSSCFSVLKNANKEQLPLQVFNTMEFNN